MTDAPRLFRLPQMRHALLWRYGEGTAEIPIDTASAMELRGCAMFLLITTHGLHSSKDIAIVLNDIQWRQQGILRINQRKLQRLAVLTPNRATLLCSGSQLISFGSSTAKPVNLLQSGCGKAYLRSLPLKTDFVVALHPEVTCLAIILWLTTGIQRREEKGLTLGDHYLRESTLKLELFLGTTAR